MREAVDCQANGIVTCGDENADDCLEWSPPVPCTDAATCSDGVCSETCTDECVEDGCDELSFRACGQYDLDACSAGRRRS